MKKFIKAKLLSTHKPQNGRADEVRSHLGGHLRPQIEAEDFAFVKYLWPQLPTLKDLQGDGLREAHGLHKGRGLVSYLILQLRNNLGSGMRLS